MKFRFWMILLVFIGLLALWTRLETAKASNNTNVLRLELGYDVNNFKTINIINSKYHSLTLVTFRKSGKKYVILHSYSRFKKDKLIFLQPQYKVVRINRQDLLLQKTEVEYFKAVE